MVLFENELDLHVKISLRNVELQTQEKRDRQADRHTYVAILTRVLMLTKTIYVGIHCGVGESSLSACYCPSVTDRVMNQFRLIFVGFRTTNSDQIVKLFR